MSAPHRTRRRSTATAAMALSALLFASAACDAQAEEDVAAAPSTAPTTAAPTTDVAESEPETTPFDSEAFCAQVAAMDETDGTTDEAIVVSIFEEFRRTAPAEIREDVDLVSDAMIATNYPSSADSSMTAAPIDQLKPASDRIGSYVDEHCALDI